MPALGFLLVRVWYAWKAVGQLLTNRALARRLPWAYIRRKARTDWAMAAQLVGVVAILVMWPLGAALQPPARNTVIVAGVGVWALSLGAPWVARTVRTRRKRSNHAR